MPAWVHDRAYHLLAKNPEMDKRTAFAIATQQAHATKHTPKGFGTAKGKKDAKAKYTQPRKSYVQTADPKKIGKKLEAKTKVASMKPYHDDVEQDTLKNDNYRKVLFTGKHSQLVLMSIPSGADIGEETHPSVDQFFRIEEGEGKSVIDGIEYPLKNATGLIVPAGSKHNIFSTGKGPLKLYSIYSPPNHPPGTIHATKADQPIEKNANGDEEDEVEREPTEAQKSKIREFIRTHRIKNDDEFHKFVEGIGVSAHNAEPIVYQMAHNTTKTAEEHSVMSKSLDLVKMEGFSDELHKMAMEDKLAVGGMKAVSEFIRTVRGRPRIKWSLKNLKSEGIGGDTAKMMGTQLAVGGAATTAGVVGAKKHKKKSRERLGKAYVLGARDMYGRLHQNAMRRAQGSSGSRPGASSSL